ncbi:MAG: hypothetical protein MUE59_06215 [Thiobacillaceae bacterium]|jgi:hypothetical protein|nr:hypothetical protein [Thiobacillaceae bacterium]
MIDWTEKQRAAHARALLDDPMIEDFFVQTRERIFAAWQHEQDPAKRQALWDRGQALDEFRAYLHGFVAAGTMLTREEQIR